MNARRLVSAAALAALLCVSAPTAFAGDVQQPWGITGPDGCTVSLLDCISAGVDAALTVL